MPDNFEIANQWVAWLLLLPLLIYLFVPALRLRSASLFIPNYTNTQKYTRQKPRHSAFIKRRNVITWIVMYLIWVLLIAALSGPHLVGEPELKIKTSRNFLVVADISLSMSETDWEIDGQRVRRWDAVKSVMHDFIDKRSGDRMGLIFFGSSAYIQAPFTSDLAVIDQMLEEADVGMAGQMTHIGKAIVKGVELFERDTIKSKVMLLLTDGVDAGTEILPMDAAKMASKDSVIIYTIGIGTPGVRGSDLDEKTLEGISELTDGQYFRAMDAARLEEIYEELDKLEPIEYEEEEYRPITVLYYYPLTAALILTIFFSLMFSSWTLIRSLRQKREDYV